MNDLTDFCCCDCTYYRKRGNVELGTDYSECLWLDKPTDGLTDACEDFEEVV